jgi:hypothetical protein
LKEFAKAGAFAANKRDIAGTNLTEIKNIWA